MSVDANLLADVMLDGPWTAVELAERSAAFLERWPSWLTTLAMRLAAVHRSPPSRAELAAAIAEFLAEHPDDPPLPIRPVAGRPRRWPVATIDSVAELAERFELDDGQLAWLADVRGLERRAGAERLRNYRYRWIPRAGDPPRLIEMPKARLKEIQRWVLHAVLDAIPVHPAAHGFARGRSVITNGALHTSSEVIVQFDLKDFFASISAARVRGVFRTAGYSEPVARTLTGLATNRIPLPIWSAAPPSEHPQPHFWLGRRLATPHLPQGAPSSPALANLAAFRLDRRLTGLAAARGLRYSRYADDLTFSGARRSVGRLGDAVAEIAAGEGFALNGAKTRSAGRGGRQAVCGVVVNAHPNVARTEYDALKAIVYNTARHGPAGQNLAGVADFRAHLRGRIAWVAALNPDRGAKLLRHFAEIDWGADLSSG